jgi:hypothetical protein
MRVRLIAKYVYAMLERVQWFLLSAEHGTFCRLMAPTIRRIATATTGTTTPFGVARVSANPSVNFIKSQYDDDFRAEGCPTTTIACRKKSHVASTAAFVSFRCPSPIVTGTRSEWGPDGAFWWLGSRSIRRITVDGRDHGIRSADRGRRPVLDCRRLGRRARS